ncbi:MAG TPA: HI0074 family nucleotidyltransferase substrate-binding subunit [Flavipsychrobacter sp.]|nr:HI0074 family nucleotidyltransferase substrate-binding subunit [Flavipsychrobacter sp.]
MEHKDIRWQQRFANYERAFKRLSEAMQEEELNELERNGLVQRFEFTLELAWKTMKDFLEEKGFAFKPSPKDTFRQAQEGRYIDYAQELIDGLDIRNELSHDYDGKKFESSERQLREEVYPALSKLYRFFIEQRGGDQKTLFNH